MSNYIDYYILRRTGEPQDFEKALTLGDGWDADHYIEAIQSRFNEDGEFVPSREDGDELTTIDGEEVLIMQYHNGVSDGGDHDIANSKWVAEAFPEAFKLLGISVTWGKGTGVFTGKIEGIV